MKTLLILCEAFHPEDFIINDLARHWASEGRDVEVLTRTPSYPYGRPYDGFQNRIFQTTISFGLKVRRVAIVCGYKDSVLKKILNYLVFSLLTTIYLIFAGKRYDRIFVYQTGPLTQAIAAVVSKLLYGNKVIIWTQDLWPDTVFAYGFRETRLRKALLDRFVRWIYRSCDVIVVSCEGFLAKIAKMAPGMEMVHVPNWPALNEDMVVSQKSNLPPGFNFTFAGNVGKVQNLENVILGFEKFVRMGYPQAHLNIIGDGSNLESLKQLVAKHGVPQVHFLGRRPMEEMPSYFAASDVLVISLDDNPLFELTVPSKFQAYLTASRPIYSLVKGEVSKLVEKHSLGIAADPSDVDSICSGFVDFVIIAQDELQKFAVNAHELLREKYTKNTNVCLITQLLWPSLPQSKTLPQAIP